MSRAALQSAASSAIAAHGAEPEQDAEKGVARAVVWGAARAARAEADHRLLQGLVAGEEVAELAAQD